MVNPLALAIQNPDTAGKAFQGFEYGRKIAGENALARYGLAASTGDKNALAAVYEAAPVDAMNLQAAAGANAKSENEARIAKFGTIGNIAGSILRLPPEQRGAALTEAKGAIANMFGNDPQVMGVLQQVTPDNIQFYAEALTDELTRLKQDKVGAEIGLVGAKQADIGIDNSRDDWRVGAGIADAARRTDIYGANAYDQIAKRADGNAPAGMKAPSGYRYTESGDLAYIPGGPADPKNKGGNGGVTVAPDGTVTVAPGKMTEYDKKTVAVARRAMRAANNLETAADASAEWSSANFGQMPGVGNYLKSDAYQYAEQQGRELISALLRPETGAAVTDAEWALYGPMIMPQPGDSDQVKAQKRATRRQMVEDLKVGLGSAGSLVGDGMGAPGGDTTQPAADDPADLLKKYGIE